MRFICRLTGTGFDFGDSKEKFLAFAKKNAGIRVHIEPVLPESRSQRKFLFGACYQLWAFLDGKDYKDSDVIEDIHNASKLEFNGHFIVLKGKTYRIGKSTKGHLQEYINKVVDFLEEQYGVDRTKVLNPEHYRDFVDRIYSDGQFDTYIQYLQSLRLL